ncbi:MAG TPA: 3-oxoacyl-[acyl-carrier-protein] synthase III C-terminal domain-containing protein [Thermoanaerobaculia bacterium]
MREAYVNRITSALGEEARDVEQTAAAKKITSSCEVFRQAGFARHHVCRQSTTAYDLAHRAVTQLGSDIDGTGAIIYSTCLPMNANLGAEEDFERDGDVKHLMDFPASHMQADFGLDGACVIGLTQQACTSLLGSIRLARSLLVAEEDLQKVLCVTADRFPNGALYEQAYNLISDGAAACVVSDRREGFRVVATHAITNGALAQASDDETVGTYFNYMHKIITELLAKAKLRADEIDWVVPQNTNVSAWKILARLLQFNADRVFLGSIAEIGHIISSDNLVNLQRLDATGVIRSGERLLLVMAGFGLNWQALILEKV